MKRGTGGNSTLDKAARSNGLGAFSGALDSTEAKEEGFSTTAFADDEAEPLHSANAKFYVLGHGQIGQIGRS